MRILLTTCILICNMTSYAQANPAAVPAKTAPVTKPAATTQTTKPNNQTNPVKPSPASKPAPAAKPKAIEWTDLDLSTANPPLPLIIKAPKGATIVYNEGILISADSVYAVVIDMSYSDMPKSIADRKKDAQENEVFKVQKFMVDKPDMILYEVKYNGKSEYHFDIAREIKGEKYFLHDKWIADKSFTQKEIDAMLESAKGLKAK
jgi:hypothetical protein